MQRLNENLGKLTAKFEKATSDKLKCQQEAEATACTITLANWLVSGSRWGLAAASMGDAGRVHSTSQPLIFMECITFPALQQVFSNGKEFALAVFIDWGRQCVCLKRCCALLTVLVSFL